MIISVCGKGGVGKTTICALILDELARSGYRGPALAVDGDPASTLHLLLGLPAPAATIADVRERIDLSARAVRELPAGVSAATYVFDRILAAGVLTTHRLREMPLHLVTMGQGEGPGCYCSLNHAFSRVLNGLAGHYPFVLIDNEAGLEHISRYRLDRADLLLAITLPNRASRSVAQRILKTAGEVETKIGTSWLVFNRAPADFVVSVDGLSTLFVPGAQALEELEVLDQPVVDLADGHPVRQALQPVLTYITATQS